MKKIFTTFVLLTCLGCGAKNRNDSISQSENVDNSATRYVDSLIGDKSRAAAAVDKYNQGVKQEEAIGHEAGEQ